MIKNIGRKKYLVRVYNGRDAKGRRRSTSKVIYGERELAEKHELDLLQRKNKGQPLSESKLTLSAFFGKWHKTVSAKIRESTALAYRRLFDIHVEPALGHAKLTALRPGEVEEFYAALLSAGLSGRSVEYVHSILATMFADAVRWQEVAENPMKYVRAPRRKKKEMLCMTPAQAHTFILATYPEYYGLALRTALKTGLRPEEYTALKWPDVDFEYRDRNGVHRGRLSVSRTVIPGKPGGGWWDGEPKSDAGYRDVVFPLELLRELREHRARQLAHKMSLGAAYQDQDFVFATPVGTPVDSRFLSYRIFKRVLKAARLSEKFRLYDLRHSWVTLSLMAGADVKTISRQAGHASVAFTLQTYAHVLPEMREAASDKFEALLLSAAQ